MAKGFLANLKGVDAFGKTAEDVKIKTRTGALLTLISAAIIFTFMTVEFFDYRRVVMDTSIVVDKSRGQALTVWLNVTFPRVPCYLLSLDVMDVSGEVQRDITHQILKVRLDKNGNQIPDSYSADPRNDLDRLNEQRSSDYCGSCYGGLATNANGCCNTCDEVRQAYINRGWSFNAPESIAQCVEEGWADKLRDQSHEGCNISGRLRVNKVTGNIHLSPGRSFQASNYQNVYELVPYLKEDGVRHDFSHTIYQLKFTADDEYDERKSAMTKTLMAKMGVVDHPLDNTEWVTVENDFMFQYFLKVVSTQFRTLSGWVINTHQYSTTQFGRDLARGNKEKDQLGLQVSHGASGVPGVFLNYDISPILVVHAETRQSFAHFLTSTCAIVGGVLTVASIIDSVLFAANRALKHGGHVGGKLL
ncbi:ER-derived vesicles protein ERV46 [Thelephora ganbajun]|uniref:ER-derived vesicles protein ERV46 n=1 Tax=Thelephora ganbajun TaxID=370292 RepID=A0ACB6ZIP6_THEGA|nr:ER-derived vesicles protein ERV46 [Thelephora ganbajun]